MIWVKICGLTQAEDVRRACEVGADAVGFVMVPGTVRAVAPETVRELLQAVQPFVMTVGVIRDRTVPEAIALADRAGVGALQLHGSETPAACRAIKQARPGLAVFKALQLSGPADLVDLEAWEGLDGLLLDSGAGSGRAFDWSWLTAAPWPSLPRIVAGGLSAANVRDLLACFRPEAVDVSSGVESAPGRKDPQRMRAFVEAVRGS